MGAGTGAHHHRLALETRASDDLPSGEAVRAVKAAALAAVAAELPGAPWPPREAAHALLDCAPLVALALLEATCGAVRIERLARCLGLDPLDGPDALAALRQSGRWPAQAFDAALAALGGAR